MNALCMHLLAAAAFFAEYEPPDYCPRIELLPAAEIRHYICPGANCATVGLYIYGQERLLIDDNSKLDDVSTRSVILHELVHFLQDRAGETRDRSCHATLLRERVAFWAQEQYLRENGIDATLLHNMQFYSCEEESEASDAD